MVCFHCSMLSLLLVRRHACVLLHHFVMCKCGTCHSGLPHGAIHLLLQMQPAGSQLPASHRSAEQAALLSGLHRCAWQIVFELETNCAASKLLPLGATSSPAPLACGLDTRQVCPSCPQQAGWLNSKPTLPSRAFHG